MVDLKMWMYKRKSIQFKSQNSKTQKHNFSQKIAFLIDGRSDQNLKTVSAYIKKLQQKGKEVSLLFLTDHANPEQINFQAFNKKSFNWFYIPKAPVILDFVERNFDLLISFNVDNIPELSAIVDLSRARFKIGIVKENSDLFDLAINPVREDNWDDYIRTLERTMSQLCVETEYA